jgi:hypothetical protein
MIEISEKASEGLRFSEQAMEPPSDLVVDGASKNKVHLGLHLL